MRNCRGMIDNRLMEKLEYSISKILYEGIKESSRNWHEEAKTLI